MPWSSFKTFSTRNWRLRGLKLRGCTLLLMASGLYIYSLDCGMIGSRPTPDQGLGKRDCGNDSKESSRSDCRCIASFIDLEIIDSGSWIPYSRHGSGKEYASAAVLALGGIRQDCLHSGVLHARCSLELMIFKCFAKTAKENRLL
jgi:hypothetical protein